MMKSMAALTKEQLLQKRQERLRRRAEMMTPGEIEEVRSTQELSPELREIMVRQFAKMMARRKKT
ncbi:hypothetical protein N9M28_05490 [Luminiphilus sp.]|nr:hypothetical protein [Luminiphilus sp.]